jgi:hypothetical protein
VAEKIINRTIIPASSGWLVCHLVDGGPGPDEFVYEPIIAWEIERIESDYHPRVNRPDERCVFHGVMPLTTNGNMNNQANLWCIKRPDGKFEVLDSIQDTEAEAMKQIKNPS